MEADDDDDDQSGQERNMGGYDPAVRRMLAKAEKKGCKAWKSKGLVDDTSGESEIGDSDRDSESEDPFPLREFCPTASSTRVEEDRRRALREVERTIDQCLIDLDKSTKPESQRALENQLEELQMQKRRLQKKGTKKWTRNIHYVQGKENYLAKCSQWSSEDRTWNISPGKTQICQMF